MLEIILWFLMGKILVFAFVWALVCGMSQPVLPLFWWLYLCYEPYLDESSDCSSFVLQKSPRKLAQLVFC